MTKEQEKTEYAKDHTIKEFAEHYGITYGSARNYLWKKRIKHKQEIGAAGTHGMRHTLLYKKWAAMKTRCTNPKQPEWKNYGGKGITLYPDWNQFVEFAKWAMANGYQDGLTIDRIDNSKGYSPSNCRWITPKEQANNRTNNHFITYKGQTKSLAQWCEELHINYWRTKSRLRIGWTVEQALEGDRYARKNLS